MKNLKTKLNIYLDEAKESDIDLKYLDRAIKKQLEPALAMVKREIKMYDSSKVISEWKEFKKLVDDIDNRIK